MRIRLHGTSDEITAALGILQAAYQIGPVSRICRDRAPSRFLRVYLDLRPAESDHDVMRGEQQ